jgi:hypothetical protein
MSKFLNKTVYTINYRDLIITPHVVTECRHEGHNGDIEVLKTANGKVLFSFKETALEAEMSLVGYYETRLNVANTQYQEALKVAGVSCENLSLEQGASLCRTLDS